MSTVIQIKRSTGATAPTTTTLAEGELAYSQDRSNNGKGAILYIESVASDGTTQVIDKIGGKYYTSTVDSFLTPENGTLGAKLALKDADASHSITLQAPAELAANRTYTLPSGAPTANYFLKTDADGNLTWSEVSGNTLNINGLTETTALADADEFIIFDASAGANRKMTAENVADYIFGGVSGDITISESGVAAIGADAVELGVNTTGNYVATVSGTANQVQVTGSGSETAAVTVSLTDDVVLVGDLTVGGNDIKASGGTTAITLSGADVDVKGDLTVTGNDIKSSSATAITLTGADVDVKGDLTVTGNDIKSSSATALTLAGADVEVKGDLQVTGNDIKASTGDVAVTLSGANVTVKGDLTVEGNDISSSSAVAMTLTGADVEVKGDLQVTGNDIKSSTATAMTLSGADVEVKGDLQVTGNDIKASTGDVALAFTGADVAVKGDLTVEGNDIKSSSATAMTLAGADVEVKGDLQVTGNDIKSSTGATAISLDGANVTVAGNLTVNGTSTLINSTIVTVDDNMLKLADGNTLNTLDVGSYGQYVESSTTKFAGFFRDASDNNIFKFFKGLEVEPSTTVDTGAAGYSVGTLFANLTGGTVSGLASAIGVSDGGTGATTLTSNGVLYGNGTGAIQATAAGTNGYFLYSNAGTPAWTNVVDGGTF